MSVWQGMSLRTATSARSAKLIISIRWFAFPDRVLVEPCHEFPMYITKLRLLFHVRMGSYLLPVEQGRLCQDTYVAAYFATMVPWMKGGTAFSTARI